jgi:hypothetical protein
MAYLSELGGTALWGAIEAGARVAEDPYLPEVTCHILRLDKITDGLAPGPRCLKTVATKAHKDRGIGMESAAGPLRAFVWYKEHPAIVAALGLGAVGLVWYLGYSMGRKKRRV